MNSVRPIITITVLGIVAYFLYVKINQGALRPAAAPAETAQTLAPPLTPSVSGATAADKNSKTADARTTGSSLAPTWNLPETKGDNGSKVPDRYGPPATPSIPALPDLPAMPEIAGPDSTPPGAGLSQNPPGLQYGTGPTSNKAAPNETSPFSGIGEMPQPVNATNPVTGANPLGTPTAPPLSATLPTSLPATGERDTATKDAMSAMGLTPQTDFPSSAAPNSAPVAAPSSRYGSTAAATPAAVDRYGVPIPNSSTPPGASGTSPTSAAATTTSPTNTPGAPSFAASWPQIQSALNRGELAKAHQMLSPWFGDPSLTAVEAERVESLLGQLAGTVIYSTEHRLEPAYPVKPGETLESIAKQLDVPWQLLAKINGMSSPEQVRPGQQLKVVRGPFAAMVDLRRNQLALMVDGRYAGKFAVSAPATANIPPGEWIVADKPSASAAASSVYASPGSLAAPPAAASRSILLRSAANDIARQGMTVRIAADGPGPLNGAGDIRPDAGSSAYLVKVSPRDAEELSDILSIGSRVIIQR